MIPLLKDRQTDLHTEHQWLLQIIRAVPLKQKNTFSNYNPLLFTENQDSEKHTFLNAICCDIHKKYPALKIISTRSEDFTNEFIDALGKKELMNSGINSEMLMFF